MIETLREELSRTKVGQKVERLEEEVGLLSEAINGYVLDHYDDGDGYEDSDWKATRVVSHRRTWNVERLARLVPKAVFKNVTTTTVVPAKIDQMVRAGKVTLDELAPAYEETANAPYVKVTRRSESSDAGQSEAEELAAKLA